VADVARTTVTLNQIRYFLALCEEANVTRAAKRCSISQPSLTNAVRALENELGGRLFDRDRCMELTALGRKVWPYFFEAFRAVEAAEEAATRATSPRRRSGRRPSRRGARPHGSAADVSAQRTTQVSE
jgi:DNA-binding transcriptional LysR family regulator